jgi:hypothetical protein
MIGTDIELSNGRHRLIKVCLIKAYSKDRTGKHLSDVFPIQNGLKQGALSPFLFSFTLEYAIKNAQQNK